MVKGEKKMQVYMLAEFRGMPANTLQSVTIGCGKNMVKQGFARFMLEEKKPKLKASKRTIENTEKVLTDVETTVLRSK